MTLFRPSQIIFSLFRNSENAASKIPGQKRQVPLVLCETVHHQAPFLSVVEPECLRPFHAHQRVQHGSLHRLEAVLIQASASVQTDVLINNSFEYEAEPVWREKTAKAPAAKNSVYARLEAAGARLLVVIRDAKGMANKDLARFADQINALCDKWKL